MKKKNFIFLVLATLCLLTSCERIDAGYEGIKTNLFGDEKGVDNVSLVTGIVWYNPLTTAIHEYPTFVQTIDYPPFEVNSKDGTKFTVDPSALIKIEDGKSPVIFKKYRKDVFTIIHNTLYVYIKDAARIEFNKYNADQIVSNREAVDLSFENRVRETFIAESFVLEQLSPGIKYPQSYEDAINAKNKAVQDQMRVQNEVEVAKAEVAKQIAKAEGDAQALKIKGDAEAEYNKKIAASLSSLIVQQMMLEKWDGKLPTFTGGNGTILDASKLLK